MRVPALPSGALAPTPRTGAALAGLSAILVAIAAVVGLLVPALLSSPLNAVGLAPGPALSLRGVLILAAAVALLMLGRALWRGSRRAALVVSATLATLAVAFMADGQATLPAVACLGLALVLAVARQAFPRGGARDGLRLPALIAGVATGGLYAVAAIGLLVTDQVSGAGAAAGSAGSWIASGAWWLRSGAPASIALDVLMAITLASVATLLHATLRPTRAREGHTLDEHERAAHILAAHATDSLDPFALRADKSFHFAHDGFVAYRVLRGTAVVSGDPVGPAGAAPAILSSFTSHAAECGWDVVVTAASGRYLDAYRRLGFGTLCIGEEAVVDPSTFTLDGGRMKVLRKAVNRVPRRGWSVEVVPAAQMDDVTANELARVDASWRTEHPSQSGFAMTLGRLWGGEEDADCVFVVGRDPDGEAQAFLRFLGYGDGLSLDLMRRAGESPNGLNDAMVAAAIEHARERGLRAVSLNFAGFSHVMGDGESAPLGRRLARWALRRTHGRFQLERLARFNAKFDPAWEPRYLLHQGRARLPHAGLRVLQAESYVRGPRCRRLSARWEPRSQPLLAAGRQRARASARTAAPIQASSCSAQNAPVWAPG